MRFSYVNSAAPFPGLRPIMMILVPMSGGREERALATQDERLAAIAAAAAAVLRRTPYHAVRAAEVAAAVRLPGERGRSAVWLYNEVRNRRVLVALAAACAWRDFPGRADWSGPRPIGSVTAARSAAAAALAVIVAFHRAEQPLMTQVGYGIGDISTAEKRQLAAGNDVAPTRWPASEWGRVAAAAWHGRCDVFTDFLGPVLQDCAGSVTYLAEADAIESASRLSDIAFRTCLADREGPVDLVARGLAALWFERDLTRLAGMLPRDLESSETALAAVVRRRTDPRAEANANSVVVRVLLEAGTLHERCVREARRTVLLWQDLAAAGAALSDSESRGHDLQRLSDTASHLGLAAARYGDRETARDAWQLSRRVAEQDLNHDMSRMARADTNLAGLAAETGPGPDAASVVSGVFATRLTLAERQPENAAAWRRLTVTARTQADIARSDGRVCDGVRLAADLLADRRARLGDPAHADVAEARLVFGQALLVAGHPVTARRHLEEAADTRRGRFLAASYRVQEDLLWLARTALVLEQPQTVRDLLAGQAAGTDWFCNHVSFRLGYTARRLLALATAGLGQPAEAAAALLADRERLADQPLDEGLDPLAADFDRTLGEVALLRGDAAGAMATLARLAEAEARAGLPLPGRGWTLMLLGRAADRLGEAGRAADCFGQVTALGIDPCHPVILTARYDEAVRRAATGGTREAADLLEPVLDRTLLAHGYAAVGEAHPLLARARALAERLGITLPDSAAAIDEASLDIDV
jgi:tetratricopeptide (TPR) repeat protein